MLTVGAAGWTGAECSVQITEPGLHGRSRGATGFTVAVNGVVSKPVSTDAGAAAASFGSASSIPKPPVLNALGGGVALQALGIEPSVDLVLEPSGAAGR